MATVFAIASTRSLVWLQQIGASETAIDFDWTQFNSVLFEFFKLVKCALYSTCFFFNFGPCDNRLRNKYIRRKTAPAPHFVTINNSFEQCIKLHSISLLILKFVRGQTNKIVLVYLINRQLLI